MVFPTQYLKEQDGVYLNGKWVRNRVIPEALLCPATCSETPSIFTTTHIEVYAPEHRYLPNISPDDVEEYEANIQVRVLINDSGVARLPSRERPHEPNAKCRMAKRSLR